VQRIGKLRKEINRRVYIVVCIQYNMIKLRCKRCEKEWDYNGEITPKEYPQYTSCPRCKTSIKIQVKQK